MALIPIWQESPGGLPETNIGNVGSAYTADFWAAQGIFSTDARPVIVEFRGDQYVIGSFSRPVYRLAADKQWYPAGIVPPFFPVGVALSLPAPDTGINGTCLAYITFVQKLGDRKIQESNPSNIVDAGTMAGHERVWTNIQNAGAEFHVTHVRGYVSMDGADYRMAWEAPYGATTITEAVRTSALSHLGVTDFDHNIPPSGCLYGHAWAGRMAYANNAEYPYRVWFSKPGNPQYVPQANFRDTYGREPITGIYKGRNELIVFTFRRSYMLRQFGSGSNDFVLEQLDSDVGCISHHGIREIHNRLWFPGEDGIWLYDGSFRYLMSDMRELWRSDYEANKEAFTTGFAGQDRINKVYLFFTKRPDKDEWENTGLNPGTVRYVGYYANFEPSMAGRQGEPDWSLDMLDRFDAAAIYNADGEMLISSCDGIIRKQDSTDGDDDGDALNKELIIRHGHNLMFQPGDDIQSGKKLEQLWCHLEAELNAWQLRCLGGDEDSWRQLAPDNSLTWWKRDVAASALTQGLPAAAPTAVYTYCAKSVHFFIPEKVVGRGFTFEIRGTTPVGMKYRGLGGLWSPGVTDRRPRLRVACTFPTVVLDDSASVNLSEEVLAEYAAAYGDFTRIGAPYDTQAGQSFAGVAGSISAITAPIWKLGSPSGFSCRMHLYAHTGTFGVNGVPTGAALATSDDIDVATLPTTVDDVRFVFSTPFAMTPGTNYFWAIEATGGDASNHVRLALDGTGAGPGNKAAYSGVWAADAGNDSNYQILSATVQVEVTASDLDDGSVGVVYWRLDLLDAGGSVVQSDEGTNPAAVALVFTCSEVGSNTVRVSAWDQDISLNPDYESCVRPENVTVVVDDPLGLCP